MNRLAAALIFAVLVVACQSPPPSDRDAGIHLGTWVPTIAGGIGPGSWNALTAPAAASYTVTGTMGVRDTGLAGVTWAGNPTAVNNVIATGLVAASLPQSGTWWVDVTANDIPTLFGDLYPTFGVAVATGTTTSDTAYTISRYYDNTSGMGSGLQQAVFHPGAARTGVGTNGIPYNQSDNGGLFRARLLNDGTDLHYQLSWSGVFWTEYFSAASPASLAYYGFCIGNGGGTGSSARLSATIYRNTYSATLNVAQSTVSGATNATPIVVTTSANHNLVTGDLVAVHGVGGNTNANTGTGVGLAGAVPVVVLSPTTFQEVGVSGNASYTSGGTVTCVSR